MWSSRLFWKLFAAYAALTLVATMTFVLVVSRWQEAQIVEQVNKRLRDAAVLTRSDVHELLLAGPSERLQSHVQRLGREIDTRITLIDIDGIVLADSDRTDLRQVAVMENHKDRPELVQAASRGWGSSSRRSPTLGEPMMYYSLRADELGQPVGFVRTALATTKVQRSLAAIERLVWLLAVLVNAGVGAVTYLVVARILHPITTLTKAAEAIAAGDEDHPVMITSHDEIGELANSFNRMQQQLRNRAQELRASSQRLAVVLGGMMDGVIAVDERDHVVLANSAAGHMLGFHPQKAEGRPLLESVRNRALNQAVAEARTAPHVNQLEIEFGNPEKRAISVSSILVPGEPTSLVVQVLHDVTELRRLESLRQEFVANVSHELKTPLSSIKAYAETLRDGAINDARNNVRFVQRIEEQAERLHQLILDLISLAKIESGQQAFEIVSVALSEAVRSCIAGCQPVADAKQVKLVRQSAGTPLHVCADEEGVKQILSNLVDNAIKYTPSGGQVTISWRGEGPMVVIDVRDTGVGIAPEYLPRVFERFFRVDKARSRELGGTGLGLAIVKHLAQSFGGTVRVESELGEGSVFTVKLPLAS